MVWCGVVWYAHPPWPLTVVPFLVQTDIAEGIHYLHTRRPLIVHRDLKTHNSLIDRTGTVKLCDFGLVTTRNTTAGTPNYMAPELLSDKSFNKAVDVYAFGMMLWEMFTRQVPFHGWRAEDIKEHVSLRRAEGGAACVSCIDTPVV